MRLTVLGATGGVGTHLVRQALDHGHEVTAVVRDPGRLVVPGHPRLKIVTADVTDPGALGPAVATSDAVLSALGPRGTGPTSICEDGAHSAIAAMGTAGVPRYLMVSAAGMVTEPEDGPVTRYLAKPILKRLLRNGFADMRRAEEAVRGSEVNWTIVRPPRLTDREPTGRYRTAYGCGLRGGRTIARADVAACVLRLIDDTAAARQYVTVAN